MKRLFICLPALYCLPFCIYGQGTVGLEFSAAASYSQVMAPTNYPDKITDINSGIGNDFSVGMAIAVNSNFSLGFGFRRWVMPFNSEFVEDMGDLVLLRNEDGKIRYAGVYLKAERSWRYFYLTGGLDLSLTQKYNMDMVERDDGSYSVWNHQNNLHDSNLIKDFKNQVNVVLGAGPLIPIGKSIELKPLVAFMVALKPVGQPYAYTADSFKFSPMFKMGASMVYKFHRKEKD
jgi:hypothetical protein